VNQGVTATFSVGTVAATRSSGSGASALKTIKVIHTIAWGFFASCILAIPVVALRAQYPLAAFLIGVVFIEILILVLNSWRCPLTTIAARYTDERRANFDIYLPEWVARHNKFLFGTLYIAGILLTLVRWAQK
jgi:uncharacterized membrane protein